MPGEPAPAPASTRLGQLQRGRGNGFCEALTAGAAAHDDVLQCVLHDPRADRQVESRGRYYAELLVLLDVPIEPIVRHLTDKPEELGHSVLAGAWRLGHQTARELLLADTSDDAIVAGVTTALWSHRWARLVDLPPRAARVFLRLELELADCARSASRAAEPSREAALSLEQLLDLGRDVRHELRTTVVDELCRRDDAGHRDRLAEVVTHDLVYGRVRLAARVLAMLGDERLLPLATDYFAREDVFTDASRRLNGHERMRRGALITYVQHLPVARQLELAREWHARGGYFVVVAGDLLRERATAHDRRGLERFVAEHSSAGDGVDVLAELEALARIGDPRSAPLLADVVERTTCSQARRRALAGLARMPHLPIAATLLHEALWDCEDEAATDACSFLPQPDGPALARCAALANHPLAADELRQMAAARGGHALPIRSPASAQPPM